MSDRQEPHASSHPAPGRGTPGRAPRFPGERVLRRVLALCIVLALVVYFGVAVTALALRYVVLPRIDALRPRVEQFMSDKLGAQVRIGTLTAHWAGLQPSLDLTGLTIHDRAGALALTVPHASATLSWRSLTHFKPVLASLSIDQPDVLAVRAANGAVSIAGVPLSMQRGGNNNFTTWLLSQGTIILRDGTVRWRDAQRGAPELTLGGVKLAIVNRGHRHRVGLQASGDGGVLQGPLDFRANFRHRVLLAAGNPKGWSGDAYLAPGMLSLPALERYIDLPIEARAGQVSGHTWLSFAHGQIAAGHGDLASTALLLRTDPARPPLDVPVLSFQWNARHTASDDTLHIASLRMELGGQPALADGTPVTRLLQIGAFSAHMRAARGGHGQVFGMTGDTVDVGLLAEFAQALPLPQVALTNLNRFQPRGLLHNYSVEFERALPGAAEGAAGAASSTGTGTSVTSAPTAAPAASSAGAAPAVARRPIHLPAHYHIAADLDGFSLAAQPPPPGLTVLGHPHIGLPGFENLSGKIDADERHGTLTLASRQTAITVLGLFDEPRIALDHLAGQAHWTIGGSRAQPTVEVNLANLSIGNPDAVGTLQGVYKNPGHGRGALQLHVQIQQAATSRVVRYLPTSLDPRLRAYLGHAIRGGTTRNATIEVNGDLAHFPYSRDPQAGVFHIVAPFSDASFDPSPFPPRRLKNGLTGNWPVLEGVNGVVDLRQNVLRVDVDRAHYQRVAVSRASARIDDLGNRASNLVIDGNSRGPLDDMLHYLNHSPIAALASGASHRLSGDGDASLALQIHIPRVPQPHISVAGNITLADNALTFAPLPAVTQMRGTLDFTEHSLALEHVSGQFLGGEITGNGGLQPDGSIAVDVAGRVSVDAARGAYRSGSGARLMQRLSGSAPYSVKVRAAPHQSPEIVADSDLSGLGIQLPAPLDKPAGAALPLRLTVHAADHGSPATGDPLQQIDATLGPLNASYLRRGGAQPAILRGAIGIGRPAQMPAQGVSAALALPHFDIDAWRTVIGQFSGATTTPVAEISASSDTGSDSNTGSGTDANTTSPPLAGTGLTAYLPERITARADSVTFLKRHWDQVTLNATHTAGTWQANLTSQQAAGDLTWRPANVRGPYGELQAHLSKLAVPAAQGSDPLGDVLDRPNQNFPAISLNIDDLSLGQRDIGRVEVAAHNEAGNMPVWQLDKLKVSNPFASLNATANWRGARSLEPDATAGGENGARRTVFDFQLHVSDAGGLLDRLGLPRTLRGGSGVLSGKVGWRGGPTAIDYRSLSGALSLDLEHGQILALRPGVGKLLSVLSLQSLMRFMTFDFHDVFGAGLPFDHISATGTIQSGVGRTDNFLLVSQPAKISMKGSADIAREQQNLLITVVPTVSAGSAALAAAVVNPLLGLGSFVAQLVLSDSISRSFSREYAVTGSWSKPQIQQVKSAQSKIEMPLQMSGH